MNRFTVLFLTILLFAGATVKNENIFLRGTVTYCDNSDQCIFEYVSLNIYPDRSMTVVFQDSSESFIRSDDDTSDVPFSVIRRMILTEAGKLKIDPSGKFYTFSIPGNRDTVFTDSAGSIVKMSFMAGNVHYNVFPDSLSLP